MSFATAILGLLMVLWALPAQVIKNHREKRCGVVLPLIFLPIALYTVRAIYATQQGAWGIVLPDVVGVLISLICLAQWFVYRNR
jgi:putative effector of murein hydrolase LrgA (UPF0299 family)